MMTLGIPLSTPEDPSAVVQEAREAALPLSPELYGLSKDEAQFFKRITGIPDNEALKQHILQVQAEAYGVYPYPCIRFFAFTTLKIAQHPGYELLLKKAKDPGAILLDVGCCFGNDARKAVLDGFPAERILASDLRSEFWDLGYRLFKDSPETCKIHFIAGNALEDSFLNVEGKDSTTATMASGVVGSPMRNLNEVTTLTEVQGKIACIHAAALFHLFNEATQLRLARRLAALLSPASGSFIFGSHVGLPQKGLRHTTSGVHAMFCHSDVSWAGLWDGVVFEKGTVKVDVALEAKYGEQLGATEYDSCDLYQLVWRVTRL